MNNKKMVRTAAISLLVLAVLVMPVLGACAKEVPGPVTPEPGPVTPEPTPTPPKILKIGGIATLSGPVSETGLAWGRGWELCFDWINEQGGLKIGDDTYMIELILEDSKMSAEGGATAATKLVYDYGVKFVMGEIADWIVAPIYSVTSEAGALHAITYLNKSAAIEGSFADVAPDKPLAIRLHHSNDECFRPLFEYLVKAYPDVKTIAFTVLDFPGYDPFIQMCEALAEEYGLTVVGTAKRFPIDVVDFYPVWTPLVEQNPDAVFSIVCGIIHPGMQLKVARELGFTGPLFYSIPADPALARTIAGPDSTDLFGSALAIEDPNLPASIKEIEERWAAKYAEEFVSDAVFAWDGAWMLAQTIEKAQSIDPEAVLETYETLTAPGSLQSVFGPARVGGLKTTGVNRVIIRPIPISRLVDGKAEVVGFFTPDIP